MIPAIILMLMRHYQKNNPKQFLVMKVKLFYALRIALMIVVAFMLSLMSHSQDKGLSYTIKRNGGNIGSMQVRESRSGKTVSLKLQSDVKTSFILSFSAKGIEEARYDSGMLVYSSIYQRFNGSEKVNKQITYLNGNYVVKNSGKEERLNNIRIYYNLLCIYTHEPVTTTLIFSDKYQKFLPIRRLEEHHYRIKFPDGSANDYWFENGVCKRIEVDHTFYSAVMELNQ